LGSDHTTICDVRIVCASNRRLDKMVENGEFRQDLYFRLKGFELVVPPLRERKDDIAVLAEFFTRKYCETMNVKLLGISNNVLNKLRYHPFPGNVRELENCIERAVLLSSDGVIHGHNLPPTLQTSDSTGTVGTGSLKDRMSLFERDIIVDALKRCAGNIAGAGRDLNTTPRILGYKIKEQGIDCKRFGRNRS